MSHSVKKETYVRADAGDLGADDILAAQNTTAGSPTVKPVNLSLAREFNPNVSAVPFLRNNGTMVVNLRSVLSLIQNGKWETRVQKVRDAFRLIGKEQADNLKRKLPGVLFSGVFLKRGTKWLQKHSGIICVDIDLQDNPQLADDLHNVRATIEADPHTLALFLSPSGTGLKVLLRCDSERPHLESFNAARRHFAERFQLKVDNACCDVCRLCYVSFDPALFQRDDAPPLTYVEEDKVHAHQAPAVLGSPDSGDGIVPMPKDFGSVTKEQVRYLLTFIPTRPDYLDWLDVLSAVFSALTYGDGFEVLQEWSPEENVGEYRDKYDHRLQRIGIGTLFHLAKQKGFTGFPASLQTSGGVKPLTIWSPLQFEFHETDPNAILLGDGFVQRGEFTSLVGIGGLGKTRLTMWLAICHICGRDWCGLPTRGGPLKWLFLSTESSLARWKTDLSRMLPSLSDEDRRKVYSSLRLLAMTSDEDGSINAGDPNSMRRLEETLRLERPDVVVVDPFADVVGGDENATTDVVTTLRTLRSIQRRTVPEAAVIIIHHARTGAANVVQAGDNFSAGNFGRGSKALYSRVRSELQLAPASRDDPSKLVLCCGKANDCEKFKPRGIVFDTVNFRYDVDPTFDIESWRSDLDGKRRNRLVSVADVVSAVREALDNAPTGATEVPTKTVVETLTEATGANAKTVQRALNDARGGGFLKSGSKRGTWALGPKKLPAASSGHLSGHCPETCPGEVGDMDTPL